MSRSLEAFRVKAVFFRILVFDEHGVDNVVPTDLAKPAPHTTHPVFTNDSGTRQRGETDLKASPQSTQRTLDTAKARKA